MQDRKAKGIALYDAHLTAEEAGEIELAAKLLRQSARSGEGMARFALACEADKAGHVQKAVRLYRECAAAGDWSAACNLTRIYEHQGRKALYFRWLRRTAELEREAQFDENEAEMELACPAPYLFQQGLEAIAAGQSETGKAMVRRAAAWGNLDAVAELANLS